MSFSTQEELQRLGIGKKIRSLREKNNLSIDDLAFRVKVTSVLLSQIENEVVPPTVATLLNLAKVLGVGIDHFFVSSGASEEKIELTRKDERLAVKRSKDAGSARLNYRYEALSYRLKGKRMEPFFVEFDVDAEKEPVMLNHSGEEFCFCLEGDLEFISDQDRIRLSAGDALYYFSEQPHAIKGIGPGTPKALFVLLPDEKE